VAGRLQKFEFLMLSQNYIVVADRDLRSSTFMLSQNCAVVAGRVRDFGLFNCSGIYLRLIKCCGTYFEAY